MSRHYGHALRGKRALEIRRYMKNTNVTVNLMGSVAGMCYVNTVDSPADTINFLQSFEEAYNSLDPITHQPCLKAEDIIVMIMHQHITMQAVKYLVNSWLILGIELVYMPAYSPDFNPVECVW